MKKRRKRELRGSFGGEEREEEGEKGEWIGRG